MLRLGNVLLLGLSIDKVKKQLAADTTARNSALPDAKDWLPCVCLCVYVPSAFLNLQGPMGAPYLFAGL